MEAHRLSRGPPQQSFHHATTPALGPPAMRPPRHGPRMLAANRPRLVKPSSLQLPDHADGFLVRNASSGQEKTPDGAVGGTPRAYDGYGRPAKGKAPSLVALGPGLGPGAWGLRPACCKSDLVPSSLSPISSPCRDRVQPPPTATLTLSGQWAVLLDSLEIGVGAPIGFPWRRYPLVHRPAEEGSSWRPDLTILWRFT